jgi:hypothetical protein
VTKSDSVEYVIKSRSVVLNLPFLIRKRGEKKGRGSEKDKKRERGVPLGRIQVPREHFASAINHTCDSLKTNEKRRRKGKKGEKERVTGRVSLPVIEDSNW